MVESGRELLNLENYPVWSSLRCSYHTKFGGINEPNLLWGRFDPWVTTTRRHHHGSSSKNLFINEDPGVKKEKFKKNYPQTPS